MQWGLFIVLVSLLSLTSSLVNAQLTDGEYTEAFQNWMSAYGKSYATQDLQDTAFTNFKANLDGVINTGSNLDGVLSNPAMVQPGVHAYFDETASQFIAARAAAIAPAAIAAAALTSGAIAGIVVGSVVGAAAIIGGAVFVHHKWAANRKEVVASSSTTEMTPSEPKQKRPRGIDIFKNDPTGHTSITGRAPPKKDKI